MKAAIKESLNLKLYIPEQETVYNFIYEIGTKLSDYSEIPKVADSFSFNTYYCKK